MSIDLPLDRMTLAEKLETMERIWADLTARSNQFPSPDWHRDVLNRRKEQVDSGEVRFMDWKDAIADLREDSHGDSNT